MSSLSCSLCDSIMSSILILPDYPSRYQPISGFCLKTLTASRHTNFHFPFTIKHLEIIEGMEHSLKGGTSRLGSRFISCSILVFALFDFAALALVAAILCRFVVDSNEELDSSPDLSHSSMPTAYAETTSVCNMLSSVRSLSLVAL